MIKNENPILSYSKGFMHSAITLNLLNRNIKNKKGIGEKLINKYTMINGNTPQNRNYFLYGALTELAVEIATPILLACSSESIRWYQPLIAHVLIKTIPRGLERIFDSNF